MATASYIPPNRAPHSVRALGSKVLQLGPSKVRREHLLWLRLARARIATPVCLSISRLQIWPARKGQELSPSPRETLQLNRTFLEAHGITVDTVLTQSASGIQVPRLPTLILIRSDGKILNSWEGQPRDSVQRSVLKALGES
jgi:hypothetical protein